MSVWYNLRGDPLSPTPTSIVFINHHLRLCECTEAEAEIILQLKNELREKELKLTDIRLEALSSAHHLDQIREAMNRMQVRLEPAGKTQIDTYISHSRLFLCFIKQKPHIFKNYFCLIWLLIILFLIVDLIYFVLEKSIFVTTFGSKCSRSSIFYITIQILSNLIGKNGPLQTST